MHNTYNEELRAAAEQVARQKHLKSVGRDLVEQREALLPRVAQLKAEKDREQSDVDKLEGRTLTAFFASIVGKKEEKLAKERAEAYAAAARYESAAFELENIERRIEDVRAQLSSLKGCEARYDAAYRSCLSRLKAGRSYESDRIIALEGELSRHTRRKKEIAEARAEGLRAQELANEALRHLDSAKSWNNWDIYGGGGLYTHMEKHGHLDNAQVTVERLQVQLRRFKSELVDVDIRADMQVSIDGFLRFADYFYDSIFADLAVNDRINEGIRRVRDTSNEISRALHKLEDMQKSAERREAEISEELRRIVENANG